MVKIGYVLSCEEHAPTKLVQSARGAEAAGFAYAWISDHFHPWTARQANSPFVLDRHRRHCARNRPHPRRDGVTCPTIRMHPAIVAHAAATCAAILGDRFSGASGAPRTSNEHVVGQPWPSVELRHEMLEEAVAIMRLLWGGGQHSWYGRHFTVENARLFTLPDEPPRV